MHVILFIDCRIFYQFTSTYLTVLGAWFLLIEFPFYAILVVEYGSSLYFMSKMSSLQRVQFLIMAESFYSLASWKMYCRVQRIRKLMVYLAKCKTEFRMCDTTIIELVVDYLYNCLDSIHLHWSSLVGWFSKFRGWVYFVPLTHLWKLLLVI